ncbi:uncharacterized protein UV8b_03930 [Ustilaginoidea virens]|uniref:Uncharacterized protein n=1 Tax=Ustilaginoidea virens TaxID=1159556 RepID=A0A8E5HQI4_USTVR|nr:uncharacterized protein UV8b_03930 [Ustilaginoidea virens]QUC19689.1 hypothetical protein UV8b_03930 [Ustilaginoidea virens]
MAWGVVKLHTYVVSGGSRGLPVLVLPCAPRCGSDLPEWFVLAWMPLSADAMRKWLVYSGWTSGPKRVGPMPSREPVNKHAGLMAQLSHDALQVWLEPTKPAKPAKPAKPGPDWIKPAVPPPDASRAPHGQWVATRHDQSYAATTHASRLCLGAVLCNVVAGVKIRRQA